MNRIARFEKISESQFKQDMSVHMPNISDKCVTEMYTGIIIPERATSGSAGYDFYLPCDLTLLPMQTAVIPTGIRAYIEDGWFLMCCPRSGLGFKYRLRFDNTVGIIDGDYYNAANEGHIMMKLTNESSEGKILELKSGSAFAQGIFLPYGVTYDDSADKIRTGGFGSTSNKI